MLLGSTLRAAGDTHPGLLRDSNEDRLHYDPARGLFIVVDGVGGQAAGETAAETALRKLRERLEAETGSVDDRIREAITSANNEVFRLASLRPEWKGMACVLTVAVLDGADVVIGHVGDTRCYKVRRGRIDKLTKDHSPVGEREDAGQLSEAEAMRHPRRNEVYRDVGSEIHHADDPGFMDVFRVPFEQDAALLLCSDGLTDLVDSTAIRMMIEEYAGHAYETVRALITAANDAGGTDNISIVYVEGSRFAAGADTRDMTARRAADPAPSLQFSPRILRISVLLALLTLVIAWALYYSRDGLAVSPAGLVPAAAVPAVIVVAPGGSIAAAIASAGAGTEILVEPGEYRERLVLKSGVRLRSRVPRGASIRLPGGASESDAAVVALDVSDAEVAGFRIIGDAATPLGTGITSTNATVTIADVEIQGAGVAAVVFETGAAGSLLGSDVHSNPGAGVIVKSGAAPRIVHNRFAGNASSERAAAPMLIESGGRPEIRANTFVGVTAAAIVGLAGEQAAALATDNWFVPGPRPSRQGPR
jgi:serine/threonine protein phosphatase PrpC